MIRSPVNDLCNENGCTQHGSRCRLPSRAGPFHRYNSCHCHNQRHNQCHSLGNSRFVSIELDANGMSRVTIGIISSFTFAFTFGLGRRSSFGTEYSQMDVVGTRIRRLCQEGNRFSALGDIVARYGSRSQHNLTSTSTRWTWDAMLSCPTSIGQVYQTLCRPNNSQVGNSISRWNISHVSPGRQRRSGRSRHVETYSQCICGSND